MPSERWALWAHLAGSEKAAQVYDCLLRHGALSPKHIADRLGCPRSTLYPSFDWLREQGLISTAVRGRSVEFVAAAPSHWRMVAERRRIEADHLLAEVDGAMNEWSASYQQGERPRARAFEGEEGLRTIREEIVESGSEVWEYFAVDARLKRQAKVAEQQRIQQTSAIPCGRVLLALHSLDDAPPFFDRRATEVRWTPLAQAPFSGSLTLTQNRAYLVSPHEGNFSLVIESAETIALLRSLYVGLWQSAQSWTPPAGWGI